MNNLNLKHRKPTTKRWSRENAVQNIYSALVALPQEERDGYFPFTTQETTTGKSYKKFRDASRERDRLPHPTIVFSSRGVSLTLEELNLELAQKLGVKYKALPSQSQICSRVRKWLEIQNRPIHSLRRNDIPQLIKDKVIERAWLHSTAGVFKGNRAFVDAVRCSDGVQRLPVGFFRANPITRDAIIDLYKIHYPRKKDGVLQALPDVKIRYLLAIDERLPHGSAYIGPGKVFDSVTDFYQALGYPLLHIPEKYSAFKALRNVPPERAFKCIETVVKTMLREGMLPSRSSCFDRRDFDEAMRFGIVRQSGRIVGHGEWFSTQEELDSEFLYLMPTENYTLPLLRGELNEVEIKELEQRIIDDLIRHVQESELLDAHELSEQHLKTWSKDGTCPTVCDIENVYGSFRGVQVCLIHLQTGEPLFRNIELSFG